MAWIELHDNLPDHPKVIEAALLLKMDKDLLVGKLVRLWTWALNNREDGTFSPGDYATIAETMRFKGKPSRLVDALLQARLLDELPTGELAIHGWDERVGILIERRNAQREYGRRKNQLYSDMRLTKAIKKRDGNVCQYCGKTVNWDDRRGADGGTYDHIDPDGDNSLDNLCVCCRSCNSSKKHHKPWEVGMRFVDDSPLWQIYGRYYGRNTAEKRHGFSAITVPKPYLIDEEEDYKDKQEVRGRVREEFTRQIGREPTGAEADTLEWCEDAYDPGLVSRAVELAGYYAAASPIPYVRSTLISWATKGITTEDELDYHEAMRDMGKEGIL